VGRTVANAAIVPYGNNGGINAFVTDRTDLVLDLNGYFGPGFGGGGLKLRPVTPCRLVDTRLVDGTHGGPVLAANSARTFTVSGGGCSGIPATAAAVSLNVTVVPQEPLAYLTLWPAGTPMPLASTLNSPDGRVVANAAIAPLSGGGAFSVFVTGRTHVVIDVNGYFAP
jgi:hypothetical protein